MSRQNTLEPPWTFCTIANHISKFNALGSVFLGKGPMAFQPGYRHKEQWQNPLKMCSPRISNFTFLHAQNTVITGKLSY